MGKEGLYFAHAAGPRRHAIDFFHFATRRVTRIATLEKELTTIDGTLTVSPDGRWILYGQIDQSDSDIMLAENFR